MSIILSKTNSFINERVFYLKKFLSILLATLVVISCFSCLSVTSFAANLVASGYTEDTKDAENEADKIVAWELYDDGKLYIYQDVTGPEWIVYTEQIKEVYVQGKGTDPCEATAIPVGAFKGYPNLEKIDLSKSAATLEVIGAFAFEDCDKLKEVIVPGVSTIGDYAFYDCDELTYVFIGGGLATVGENVFKSCDKLANVDLMNGCYNIGYAMFEDCAALTSITLPDSIREIGALAFENCALTAIVIPDSVESVGEYAFNNCSSATTLYVGHKAVDIGKNAFCGCSLLAEAEIASAMTVISEGMFMNCSALSKLTIVESVEVIEKNAFKNCVALTSFAMPETLVKINDSAFAGTGLTSVNIPAEVTEIAKGAFTGCNALTDINVDVYNDSYYSVDGVVYDMDLSTVVVCPAGKSGNVVIKNGTTTIAEDAFINCKNITSVEIPESVTNIANNAFNGCADTVTVKALCTSYANQYAIARGIKTELTHISNSWKQTLAPTCLDKGSKQLVCDGCGLVYETSEIDALGHNYDDGVVTTKATCTTDGVVTFTCTRDNCGESYTQVLPATNHKYDEGVMVVPVTCTTDGTKRYTCQNDGCYDTYDEVVTALGHNYDGVVTKAPTCTEKGVKTFTCKNCGDVYTEAIGAIGHNYDAGVVTKAPTCTEKGVKTFTCNNCGDAYTEDIAAIGHNYVSVIVKESTCISKGIETVTCENCGETITNELPLGAHQWYSTEVTLEPTCTKDGMKGNKCALCGDFADDAVVLPATGHTFNSTTGMCHCGASNGQKPTTPGGSTVVTPVEPGTGSGSSSGSGSNSGSTTEAKKPDTPKMKSVTNYGYGKTAGIKVVWNKVDGAVKYRVYRRGRGEGWKLYTVTTSTQFTDKNAPAGKSWRYTVRAVNADGQLSGYESGLYVRRVLTPHLVSVKNTVKGVQVKWNAVTPANSYRVYRKTTGGWKYIGTSETTSYIDKTAVSGVKYTYTVRAVSTGTSAYEPGLSITFVAATKLTAAANVSNGVKLSWDKVSGADSYIVYRREGNGGWKRVATGVKSTSYVDKTAKNGKTYKYTVRVQDEGTLSSYYASGKTVKVK